MKWGKALKSAFFLGVTAACVVGVSDLFPPAAPLAVAIGVNTVTTTPALGGLMAGLAAASCAIGAVTSAFMAAGSVKEVVSDETQKQADNFFDTAFDAANLEQFEVEVQERILTSSNSPVISLDDKSYDSLLVAGFKFSEQDKQTVTSSTHDVTSIEELYVAGKIKSGDSMDDIMKALDDPSNQQSMSI